jgi:hypothetical protein
MTPSTTTDKTFVPTKPWHKASYSFEWGECVEVAERPATGVRDTKNRELSALFFEADEWYAFRKRAETDAR